MNWQRLSTSIILCLLTLAFALSLLGARLGSNLDGDSTAVSELYDEAHRPQFHFTPAKNWMNDPNGPVFYKGEYHLFYQYNPLGLDWGHMSWGHAVSRDLVHWQRLPIALSEENGVMIFSGSTVVDWHNSSGFCHSSTAETPTCLVAIYTGHSPKLETQNLAYSNDNGRTWTKYSANPVIDLHLAGFRDPKVFWHEGTHQWVMVTVLASQHKARFFGSADLKHWTALSDFGPAGAIAGAWECPDLFPLLVDNEGNQTKWVLSISVTSGGVTGGARNQYFIGSFDGTTFTADSADRTLWADYGTDFYASTSFSDIPKSDGRRIWLGWLTDREYGKAPIDPWRGQHSIPRELKLRCFKDGIRLVQEPIAELRMLRGQHIRVKGHTFEAVNRLLKARNVRGDTLEIVAEIDSGGAGEFGFSVRKGGSQETVIGVDTRQSKLFVDRSRSSEVPLDERFPGRDAGPIRLAAGESTKLHIFVDRSSVEVFGNQGETVISETIYPKLSSDGIELFATNRQARILKMDIWKLKSAYR